MILEFVVLIMGLSPPTLVTWILNPSGSPCTNGNGTGVHSTNILPDPVEDAWTMEGDFVGAGENEDNSEILEYEDVTCDWLLGQFNINRGG